MTGLAGAGVLVTRPRHQAGALCAALEAVGARAVSLPTLAIEPCDTPELRQRAATLVPAADWLAFTSPNAVWHGLDLLAATGLAPAARCAAVGPGTARALAERNVAVACHPDSGGGAADLLREAGFTAGAGDRVLIVRGEGGREVLVEGLRARDARVDSLAVYRREPVSLNFAGVLNGWRAGWLQVTIVTSHSGLENLMAQADAEVRAALLKTRLVTVSARIAEAAEAIGFRRPIVAADPGEASLIAAVRRAIDTEME